MLILYQVVGVEVAQLVTSQSFRKNIYLKIVQMCYFYYIESPRFRMDGFVYMKIR